MTTPVRLLVIDDHTLFRRGLIALLTQSADVTVVGEAGDAGEAIRCATELQPDLILLDNHLPGVLGVDAIPGLREAAPKAAVLMLTVSEDEQDLARALRAGARGYLLKTMDGEALAQALRRAMAGELVISPDMTGKLAAAMQAPIPAPTTPVPGGGTAHGALSPREAEILRHIARGASNKEIARSLDIAETTVKIHVQHILRKLNLSSRVQAAVYATEHGMN